MDTLQNIRVASPSTRLAWDAPSWPARSGKRGDAWFGTSPTGPVAPCRRHSKWTRKRGVPAARWSQIKDDRGPARGQPGAAGVSFHRVTEVVDEVLVGPVGPAGTEKVGRPGVCGQTRQDRGIWAADGDDAPGLGAYAHDHGAPSDGHVVTGGGRQLACPQPGRFALPPGTSSKYAYSSAIGWWMLEQRRRSATKPGGAGGSWPSCPRSGRAVPAREPGKPQTDSCDLTASQSRLMLNRGVRSARRYKPHCTKRPTDDQSRHIYQNCSHSRCKRGLE